VAGNHRSGERPGGVSERVVVSEATNIIDESASSTSFGEQGVHGKIVRHGYGFHMSSCKVRPRACG
jgi:hypothetical protein